MSVRRFQTGLLSTIFMHLKSFGLTVRGVCTPGFACHGCPAATFACPIGTLSTGIGVRTIPIVALGTIILTGLLFGRLICGFICPSGWFQDLVFRGRIKRFKLPSWTRYGKYAVLFILVILIPMIFQFKPSGGYVEVKMVDRIMRGDSLESIVDVTNLGYESISNVHLIPVWLDKKTKKEVSRENVITISKQIQRGQTVEEKIIVPYQLDDYDFVVFSPQSEMNQSYPFFFCNVCPTGTLTATVPRLFGKQNVVTFNIWLAVFVLCVVLIFVCLFSRFFCRVLCPLGACFGLLSRFSVLRIQCDTSLCTECGICDRVCPVELDVRKEVSSSECILCGDCKKGCKAKGFKWKIG